MSELTGAAPTPRAAANIVLIFVFEGHSGSVWELNWGRTPESLLPGNTELKAKPKYCDFTKQELVGGEQSFGWTVSKVLMTTLCDLA